MLILCRRFLLGPVTKAENESIEDLNSREMGFLIPLVILMIAIGLFSPWVTDRITPSVDGWLARWTEVTTP